MYSSEVKILIVNEKPVFHSEENKDLFKYVISNYGKLQGYYFIKNKLYKDELLKDYRQLWNYTYVHSGIIEPITGLKDKNGEEFQMLILTALFYSYQFKDGFYGRHLYEDIKKYCEKNGIEYNFDEE